MEKENKKLKITANKKVIVFSLIALALLIIGSTSYAYFTAVIEGNDTAKQTSVTSGTMSVKLINTEEINLNGMMPGDSKEVHFSVQNTGSATATYGVGLLVSENNFGDKTDLVYTITSDNAGGSKAQSVLPSKSTTTSTLIPVVSIPTGKTQNYTMTITFKETNDDQNDNQGKTFSGKIQLVSADVNTLASRILTDNTVKTNPVWSETSTDKGVYKLSGDKTIDGNPTYYYRGNVENNYVKFGKNKNYPIFYTDNKEKSDSIYNCFIGASNDNEENLCVYNEGATMLVPKGADLIWRIVRIAEDGSIRLILDTNSSQLFRLMYDGQYGLGNNLEKYTLEFSGSLIELELQDFINFSLTSTEQSKLIDSKICNTGLITEENHYVDETDRAMYREEDDESSFNCMPEEKINTSVSMLTAPEIYYSSTEWKRNSWYYETNSYFNTFADASISSELLTMSMGQDMPGSTSLNVYRNYAPWTFILSGELFGGADLIDGPLNDTGVLGIRPVINLNPNVKVLNSGNGTKDNPYVIE